jgi:hypothetical protein
MGWYITSTRALARVLQVDEASVRHAERDERIRREPDGRWELWTVLDAWRDCSGWFPGRAPAWLDPSRRVTPLMEHNLVARAQAAGAEYEEDEDSEEGAASDT